MIPKWHWTPYVFCIDVGSWCLHPRRESRRLWLQISPSLSSNTSGASWWFTAGTATNVPQLWVSSSCTEAWLSPPCRCALSLCLDPGLWNNEKKKKFWPGSRVSSRLSSHPFSSLPPCPCTRGSSWWGTYCSHHQWFSKFIFFLQIYNLKYFFFILVQIFDNLHNVPSVLPGPGPGRETRDGAAVPGTVQRPHQGKVLLCTL